MEPVEDTVNKVDIERASDDKDVGSSEAQQVRDNVDSVDRSETVTGLQLAEILGCDDSQISRWRKSGKLLEKGWDSCPGKAKGRSEYFRINKGEAEHDR